MSFNKSSARGWLRRFGTGLFGRHLRNWISPSREAPRPQVEVLSIAPAAIDADKLLDYAVDEPKRGHTSSQYSLDIRGWVVGKQAPARAAEVLAGTRLVRSAEVWLPREDLAERFAGVAHAGACGFHACVSTVGLHPEFTLRLEAVFADGNRVPLGTIRGRHEPLRTGYWPRRQPVLVTSLGRSGTTWLMRLLGEHPAIAVHPRYPFESCPGLYLLHALQVFSTPSNPVLPGRLVAHHETVDSVYPLPLFCRDEEPILHGWVRSGYVKQCGEWTLRMIDDLYDEVAQLCGKPAARYWCEKTIGKPHTSAALAELYPEAKEIFLVRDFRDMVCSRQSFFGPPSGAAQNGPIAGVLADVRGQLDTLLEQWQARRTRAHLVRYEDLVLRPVETLQEVFAYLDLNDSRRAVAKLVRRVSENPGIRTEHRTVQEPVATIGRWRRDLATAEQAICATVCGEALQAFGYAA